VFDTSAQTNTTDDIQMRFVDSMTFTAVAPSYTNSLTPPPFIPGGTVTLAFVGTGIVNNSSNDQFFGLNRLTEIYFSNSATAANATFTLSPRSNLKFFVSSTAGNANINLNGSADVSQGTAGVLTITGSATAGNATIRASGGNFDGGHVNFLGSSTAGSATMITNGGNVGATTAFQETSDGGTAVAITNAGGVFDISALTSGGMNIGSISGVGTYFLGSKNLSVGGNNQDSVVSGFIQDGGLAGGTGGSLTKIGTGTLTLSGTNNYSGATLVSSGVLVIAGTMSNSAVTVAAGGVLTGTGTINGPLLVNSNGEVDLAGGTLTINGPVTNNGLFILSNGSNLFGVTSFISNGTLDIMTAGAFTPPNGFVNNGVIIDASVVKIKSASLTGTTMSVGIDSYTGHIYQLQTSTSLENSNFQDVGAAQAGSTGTVLTFIDSNSSSAGFYRVLVNP
jgi:autotransporter-associated beta strand protein